MTKRDEPSYLLAISEDITERKHAEQAVRESEERFRQVAESASEWIWEVDENGLYRYCSDAVERILGYSSVELVGQKHFYDLFAPQVRQDFKEAAFAAFGRKESFQNFVNANVRKDGEIVILESNGTPVLDKKGNLVGYRGADTDITERKQREEALRESEERLALALDSAEISFWDWDLTTGKAVWGGGRFFDLMGYSPDEVKPDVHAWKRLIHLEDWPHVSKALNDHLDGYLPIYGAEYRVQTKSGDWKWVLSQGKVVKRDKDGRSVRLVGTTQDISKRKLAEEALRDSEKRYRSLFENMLEGFAYCKMIFEDGKPQDFIYLGVNDSFERLTGLKNVVGHKVTEAIPGISESNPELFKIYGRVTSTGNPERFETYIDSLGIWLSVSVSSTERDHFVTVFDNITERKRSEEALRTSEAQLSNAVKMARLGHWEYDVVKDLFTFNDRFYELFRTTAEQVGGYTLSSADYAGRFVHPDDIPVVGEEIRKSIEAADPHFSRQLEHRIIYADGEIGYITVQFFIIKDELGRTVRTYGVNQDVTERKRAEEALRKSEERLELALQGGDLGLWDLHIPTGQAVANQRAAEIVGYSLDEIEQNFGFWERLLHPDDRQRALEKVFNHLAGLTDHYEDEYRVRHKSGDWRWIFSRGKVTERDQDGKPLRMTGTYLDITDRKTSELQVAEANELREKIVAESPMGIAVYKADGQCISANEALGRILGADRERLLTQNFRNLTSWKVSGLLADAELVLSGGINNQREA